MQVESELTLNGLYKQLMAQEQLQHHAKFIFRLLKSAWSKDAI